MRETPIRPGELFEGSLEQTGRQAADKAISRFFNIATALSHTLPIERRCPCALAMERYRREVRVGEDWHTWVGKV